MKTKTNIKAGYIYVNHNATLVRTQPSRRGRRVKTGLKAGAVGWPG